eukprot:m.168657 g.168657  ORF g.168657 m.168657 type:complete len:114 (+) comp14755_c0_seq8:258-599(+)
MAATPRWYTSLFHVDNSVAPHCPPPLRFSSAGGARGIRVGEMYQAVLPTMAPPVGSGGPAAAAIAAAREPVRSVLEHVPDAERVEKKRKTGETPTPEAEGPEDSDDKKHRPER